MKQTPYLISNKSRHDRRNGQLQEAVERRLQQPKQRSLEQQEAQAHSPQVPRGRAEEPVNYYDAGEATYGRSGHHPQQRSCLAATKIKLHEDPSSDKVEQER